MQSANTHLNILERHSHKMGYNINTIVVEEGKHNISSNRDISIDIIKFIAVLFIINSHADMCYPRFSALATGGAIGDALFLFCSGYTLFWGGLKRFDNWYKRRVCRIYPSVFACLIVSAIIGKLSFDSLTLVKLGGGSFVLAIMVYYILLYCVQQWLIDRIPYVIGLTVIVTIIAYWFFPYKYEVSNKGLYGITTQFRWIPYFVMMLMGAWLGMKTKKGQMRVETGWQDPVLMVVCLVVFYGLQFAAKKVPAIAPWQIVTVPFLAGIVYYFWRCCNAEWLKSVYESKTGNWLIMAIGGLCLESYLIQFSLFTDKLNFLFPLNIPLMMLIILVVSYVCRCLARIISQTFRTEDYEWKRVFEIK